MKLKTIFWPWSQLIDLEREVGDANERARKAEADKVRVDRALSETLAELRQTKYDNQRLEQDWCKNTELLRKAHFRNPATGRLGRKGERFA